MIDRMISVAIILQLTLWLIAAWYCNANHMGAQAVFATSMACAGLWMYFIIFSKEKK